MPKKRASPWAAADARAVLVEQEASGLSLSDFARREGIDADRLYRWRRVLAQAAGRETTAVVQPAVIELRAGPRSPERVEVVLASGVTLRVAETIDPSALARLIAAVR